MQAPAKAVLVDIHNLSKIFYTEKIETHALSNVSLRLLAGDYVSIAGPSGCGKSTLLSILGLLDSPTSGKFTLNGTDVANLSAAERARIRNREIGFVFQEFNLIGDLTVLQNVALPLTFRNVKAAERDRRAMECLEKVGMVQRAEHFPSQLSGGQQQRVAIARALVGKPSVLLADEPTGNLDSHNGDAVMQLLSELSDEGVTICLVTHDGRYAGHAKRVINLFDGKIVEALESHERVSPQLRRETA